MQFQAYAASQELAVAFVSSSEAKPVDSAWGRAWRERWKRANGPRSERSDEEVTDEAHSRQLMSTRSGHGSFMGSFRAVDICDVFFFLCCCCCCWSLQVSGNRCGCTICSMVVVENKHACDRRGIPVLRIATTFSSLDGRVLWQEA